MVDVVEICLLLLGGKLFLLGGKLSYAVNGWGFMKEWGIVFDAKNCYCSKNSFISSLKITIGKQVISLILSKAGS